MQATGQSRGKAWCGSLDKIALPLSVREPATAQELEPVPASTEPEPSTRGIAWLILAALLGRSWHCVADHCSVRRAGVAPMTGLPWDRTPYPQHLRLTMGAKSSSSGYLGKRLAARPAPSLLLMIARSALSEV